MKDFGAFLDMQRYKNWAHKILKASNYLKTARSPLPPTPSTECLVSALHPKLFLGGVENHKLRSMPLNPCIGRWQVPICS